MDFLAKLFVKFPFVNKLVVFLIKAGDQLPTDCALLTFNVIKILKTKRKIAKTVIFSKRIATGKITFVS